MMKKLLIIPILMWISFLVVGCDEQDDVDTQDVDKGVVNDKICVDNWWILTNRADGWDITVCAFDDNTFCFLEDLESWLCEKWFLPFDDVDNSDENSVANECDNVEDDIVCWKDGNTYKNRCLLEAAWVEEEIELSRVEDWRCIFY
jgi:hypothetical protein